MSDEEKQENKPGDGENRGDLKQNPLFGKVPWDPESYVEDPNLKAVDPYDQPSTEGWNPAVDGEIDAIMEELGARNPDGEEAEDACGGCGNCGGGIQDNMPEDLGEKMGLHNGNGNGKNKPQPQQEEFPEPEPEPEEEKKPDIDDEGWQWT